MTKGRVNRVQSGSPVHAWQCVAITEAQRRRLFQRLHRAILLEGLIAVVVEFFLQSDALDVFVIAVDAKDRSNDHKRTEEPGGKALPVEPLGHQSKQQANSQQPGQNIAKLQIPTQLKEKKDQHEKTNYNAIHDTENSYKGARGITELRFRASLTLFSPGSYDCVNMGDKQQSGEKHKYDRHDKLSL